MQADDPPYLPVGTAVSAKYKGAFCEAKVSKVVRVVKCKVSYKNGLGNATVTDDSIKGTLRVGQLVQVKHPEKKEYVDATITKIQDCSQYTVVFDDGDITTLRRTALCLKSGRHFNESETLDQLPLTHPEHFGNPVVGGRRGRRSRQLKEDSSEGEAEEENEPDLEQYSTETGRVVCVETSDKKRSRDNWFPGLVVMPSAQPTVRINVKDEYLVRSFKDGRYYTVPKKEVSDFTREIAARVESNVLAEAVEKVLKYLDHDELPVHWEKNSLFNLSNYSDSEDNFTDSSDDEPREEKDHFVAQLYKFMDDSGTPLKSPTINTRDVDLYRLFRVVQKIGGYNRVTNQNKWRSVATRLKFPNNQNMCNQVKMFYKKCLFSYESFYRTLGCTMLNHPRNAKKSRDRTLIRGKDRATPVQSPRPEKEEPETSEKKEEEEKLKPKKENIKGKIEEKKPKEKEKEVVETSDTNSSGEMTDQSETPGNSKDTPRSRRVETKLQTKKAKPPVVEKAKLVPEPKVEEPPKKEEKDDKVQQTRSKAQLPKTKEVTSPERKAPEQRMPMKDTTPSKSSSKSVKKTIVVDDDKKRGRKRNADDKTSNSDGSATDITPTAPTVNIGDKLKVYYGPTHESKVTYEAKVIDVDKEAMGLIYLVHYTGWNNRYDEWIAPNRIAENLSATTKAKRLKQGSSSSSKANTSKPPVKRGRGMSITGRSTIPEAPRSTTPSSVTSSSSRTKSPATPATRNSSRLTRQGDWGRRTRRTSVQTDNSIHTDTDSEASESESEAPRTRSGVKLEEGENRQVRKKLTKTKGDKRKDDEDTEKEDEVERPKRNKKLKKLVDIPPEEDSDEDSSSPPKGRDFDLNQIRSELKGFTKAVKVSNATDTSEKDAISSDESTNPHDEDKMKEEETVEVDDKEIAAIEKSQSSDDIYEFKEPEPFEFESRKTTTEEKAKKRLVPRVLDDTEKSPKRKVTRPPAASSSKPEPVKESADEKKFFKRTPTKKMEEVEGEEEPTKKAAAEDPFDKLVESPCFHNVKVTEKLNESKERVAKVLAMDGPMNIFESAEDDCDEEKLDISDSEGGMSKEEPLFTNKGEIFSDSNFPPVSPEPYMEETVCGEFTPNADERKKDSDDEDHIRQSIQRVINETSMTDDDDSSNGLLTDEMPPSAFSIVKEEEKPSTPTTAGVHPPQEEHLPEAVVEEEIEEREVKKPPTPPPPLPPLPPPPPPPPLVVVDKIAALPKQISPVFQETDSSLLEAMCAATPQMVPKLDDFKDLGFKGGSKIVDSLIQKLGINKSKVEDEEVKEEEENVVEEEKPPPAKIEGPNDVPFVKQEDLREEGALKVADTKPKAKKSSEPKPKAFESKIKTDNPPPLKPVEIVKAKPPVVENMQDLKKRSPRGKILSREFIDDSDSDSSDSEERLVIARSDDDSQTSLSLDNKPDVKESDSNNSVFKSVTDDSQTQEEERAFKFDNFKKCDAEFPLSESMDMEAKPEQEPLKEEEPDSDLHSLLICEETIPGSPAPPPVVNEEKQQKLEMPFASAPCSSSNSGKNMLINNESINKPAPNKEKTPSPPLVMSLGERENPDVPTVLDNTPPTTPESTLSNLSPRGDNGDLSPNIADNESCKSTEAEGEYSNQRPPSVKVSPYSEEDTLMISESTSNKKTRDESLPSPCKKRRRSHKGSISEDVPFKRGRKSNRSRHNSDSDDDTSEHSMPSNNIAAASNNAESRFRRSPRPRKYNFYVDFENTNFDRAQRIAILQQKINEIRKCYNDERAELTAIEKRRKKIKRRKKENAKAAKQDGLGT